MHECKVNNARLLLISQLKVNSLFLFINFARGEKKKHQEETSDRRELTERQVPILAASFVLFVFHFLIVMERFLLMSQLPR